jgi:hypothetical protein
MHAERVEMVQDPKARPPKRPNRRSKPRVWLPYIGPELVELWVEHVVPYLPATTLELVRRCKVCGRESRNIVGVEVKAHLYDQSKGELVPDLHPRRQGQGVFVADSNVNNNPIFRLEEFTKAIFCTDEVRLFIKRQGFSNVDFLEYGDIVPQPVA